MVFDSDLVIPDERLSLKEGAVAPWARSTSPYYQQTLDSIARHFKASTSVPWSDLHQKVRDLILFGSGEEPISMTYDDGLRAYTTKKPFEGVIPNMERRWRETDSAWIREELERFQSSSRRPSATAARPGSPDRRRTPS